MKGLISRMYYVSYDLKSFSYPITQFDKASLIFGVKHFLLPNSFFYLPFLNLFLPFSFSTYSFPPFLLPPFFSSVLIPNSLVSIYNKSAIIISLLHTI